MSSKAHSELNSDPERSYWLQVRQNRLASSIQKCEEAARQLISLTSLLATLYFAVLAFGGIADRLPGLRLWFRLLMVLPLVCWLAALVLAIQVIIPKEVNADADELPAIFEQASRRKYPRVRWSYLFLIGSIVILAGLAVLIILAPGSVTAFIPMQKGVVGYDG